MKFTAWIEQRALKNKGFDPRLPRQTQRAERRWNDFKDKKRKDAQDDTKQQA